MAGRIIETRGSGDFKSGQTGNSGKGRAIVVDADDQDEAYTLALAFFPPVVGTIPRGSIDIKELGGGVYEIDVEYAPIARDASDATTGTSPAEGGQPPDEGSGGSPSDPVGRKYSVSTKGGSVHIERSIAPVASYGRNFGGAGAVVPVNYWGAINFKEGAAAGTDIIAPSPEFSISEEADHFELGYFVNICFMTGTVNVDAWKGFPRGTLLFLGLDAGNRDGKSRKWDLTWHFRYAPPVPNVAEPGGIIIVPGELIVPEKDGWDYLWVAYEKVKDPAANKLAATPRAAYVERVYRRTDFNKLGVLSS